MGILDPEYLARLQASIAARAREEWPGLLVLPEGLKLIGPVRDDGATAALIDLVARIAVEEFDKTND